MTTDFIMRDNVVSNKILAGRPGGVEVILEPGMGQFREFESPRVHTGYHTGSYALSS